MISESKEVIFFGKCVFRIFFFYRLNRLQFPTPGFWDSWFSNGVKIQAPWVNSCRQFKELSNKRHFPIGCSDALALGGYVVYDKAFLSHAYEIKSLECALRPWFVLMFLKYFYNVSFTFLQCIPIETFDWKWWTIPDGVSGTAYGDSRFPHQWCCRNHWNIRSHRVSSMKKHSDE